MIEEYDNDFKENMEIIQKIDWAKAKANGTVTDILSEFKGYLDMEEVKEWLYDIREMWPLWWRIGNDGKTSQF